VKLWALRPPVVRWWWLVWAVWAVQVGWTVLRWLAVRWSWTVPAGLFILGAWYVIDVSVWLFGALATGILLLALGGWAELHGARSWAELRAAISSSRRLRHYRRGSRRTRPWEDVMGGCGLIRDGQLPVLEGHVYGGSGRDTDVLTVLMAPGQLPADWHEQNRRLAAAWGMRSVRCHPIYGQPDRVRVYARHVRPGVDVPPELESEPAAVEDRQPATSAFPRTPRRGA
jgi:hypothetical protein